MRNVSRNFHETTFAFLLHRLCTAPQMILRPQIILDRKWSLNDPRATSDPQIGPQMIPLKNVEWRGANSAWQLTPFCVKTTKHDNYLRTTQTLRCKLNELSHCHFWWQKPVLEPRKLLAVGQSAQWRENRTISRSYLKNRRLKVSIN